ncbi:MAG: hypothetical protein M9890_07640 [Thermomicrobiales bacterium]|nr:hypothetical protein [Thermomicrobiales bacterium]
MSNDLTDRNQTVADPTPDATLSLAEQLEACILAQPELVSTAITENFASIREAAAHIFEARRVRFSGAGHSAAIADIGAGLLRAIGVDARAGHAFDMATYAPGFDGRDLLIAIATGEDRAYASRVVQRSGHAGLPSIAVVGPDGIISNATTTVKVGPSNVPTHLANLPAAVAAIGGIAARFEPSSASGDSLPKLREIVNSTLPSRAAAAEVAAAIATVDARVLIVAAGPLTALAQSAGLALAETGGRLATAISVEDALLGGLRALRRGDLVVQIAPSGPADGRHADLSRVCQVAGIDRWRIGGQPDDARWHTPLPTIEESLAPIPSAIPLLWLAHALFRTIEGAPSIHPGNAAIMRRACQTMDDMTGGATDDPTPNPD